MGSTIETLVRPPAGGTSSGMVSRVFDCIFSLSTKLSTNRFAGLTRGINIEILYYTKILLITTNTTLGKNY